MSERHKRNKDDNVAAGVVNYVDVKNSDGNGDDDDDCCADVQHRTI